MCNPSSAAVQRIAPYAITHYSPYAITQYCARLWQATDELKLHGEDLEMLNFTKHDSTVSILGNWEIAHVEMTEGLTGSMPLS